jgi:hypothetical protein
VTQPGVSVVTEDLVADRRDPKAVFNALVAPGSPTRILIVHGPPDIGKTYLIEHFRGPFWPGVDQVGIDFDSEFDNPRQLFLETLAALGESRLKTYLALRRTQSSPLASLVTNPIQVALKAEITFNMAPDPDGDRRRLTEAWFQDAASLDRPLVITIDCFEAASEGDKAWVRGVFLPAVARSAMVRVVIAAETPPAPNKSWSAVASVHELTHILTSTDWLPVVVAKKRKVAFEPASEFMKWICKACDGDPRQILHAIEGFDAEESTS